MREDAKATLAEIRNRLAVSGSNDAEMIREALQDLIEALLKDAEREPDESADRV